MAHNFHSQHMSQHSEAQGASSASVQASAASQQKDCAADSAQENRAPERTQQQYRIEYNRLLGLNSQLQEEIQSLHKEIWFIERSVMYALILECHTLCISRGLSGNFMDEVEEYLGFGIEPHELAVAHSEFGRSVQQLYEHEKARRQALQNVVDFLRYRLSELQEANIRDFIRVFRDLNCMPQHLIPLASFYLHNS